MTSRALEPDHYAVLGLNPAATVSDVDVALERCLSSIDDDPTLTDHERDHRSKVLLDARYVLSNPVTRSQYDLSRRIGTSGPSSPPLLTPPSQPRSQHGPDAHAERRMLASSERDEHVKQMMIGLALLVLGLLITAGTYVAADPGGTFFAAWGLIAFGGIRTVVGLVRVIGSR